MLVGPTHWVDPAVHDCGTHVPLLHDCPIGHVVAVTPRPSALQFSTCAGLPVTQRFVPGAQIRVRQVPSRQLSFIAQAATVVPSPLASQTFRAAMPEQDTPIVGIHVNALHALAVALQPCPVGQGTSAAYPTPFALQVRMLNAPAHCSEPAMHD